LQATPVALHVFRKALWKERRFEPQAFQSRQNFFAKANVTAIVIEIPSPLIGRGWLEVLLGSVYDECPTPVCSEITPERQSTF
jgi:hypothetical protein